MASCIVFLSRIYGVGRGDGLADAKINFDFVAILVWGPSVLFLIYIYYIKEHIFCSGMIIYVFSGVIWSLFHFISLDCIYYFILK